MKRAISLLLTVILAVSCLTLSAAATSLSDKIDPAVYEQIAHGSFDGMVVEIRHHNPAYPIEGVSQQQAVENDLKAQRELFEQIEAFSYYEVGTFSVGKVNIGLPYESIEKVAALENVDYISMPAEGSSLSAEMKIDPALKETMSEMNADDEINLSVWLAYNNCAYIGMSEPEDEGVVYAPRSPEAIAAHERVDAYLTQLRERRKAYASAKNEEYARRIAAAVEVGEITLMLLTPMIFIRTTVDKVMDIAALPEVGSVFYVSEQEPIEEPTDKDLATIGDKFEYWMYDKKKAVKGSDDDPILYGEKFEYRRYEELYTGDGWTLIHADFFGLSQPWEFVASIVFGNRVLSWRAPGVEDYAYYVYDAMQDTFYPIEEVDTEYYDGILDALAQLHIGRPIGDADGDKDLTILDATAVQRDLADIEALSEEDVYTELIESGSWHDTAYADADCDGEITILDATRIQRLLVEE